MALTEPDGQVSDVAGTLKNVASGHFFPPTGRPWSGHVASFDRFSPRSFLVSHFFANRDPSDADLTTRMSKSCPKSTALQPQHDFPVQMPRRLPHGVPLRLISGLHADISPPRYLRKNCLFFLRHRPCNQSAKFKNIYKNQCFFASCPFWCLVCLLPSVPKSAPVGTYRARWTRQ